MQQLTTFFNNHPWLCLATLVVLIAVIFVEWNRAKRNIFNIPPTQVTQLINRDHAVIIDVRAKEAYQQGHIINSHTYQAQDILENSKKLDKFRTKPLVIVAQTNSEGQKISAFLLKNGYNAYALAGGITAWQEAQMPLVKE